MIYKRFYKIYKGVQDVTINLPQPCRVLVSRFCPYLWKKYDHSRISWLLKTTRKEQLKTNKSLYKYLWMPNTLNIIICFPELRLSSINKTNKKCKSPFRRGNNCDPGGCRGSPGCDKEVCSCCPRPCRRGRRQTFSAKIIKIMLGMKV